MAMSMDFFGIPDKRGNELGEAFTTAMKGKIREMAANPAATPRIMMDTALSLPVENETERYLLVSFATKATLDLVAALERTVKDSTVESALMLAAMMTRHAGQA